MQATGCKGCTVSGELTGEEGASDALFLLLCDGEALSREQRDRAAHGAGEERGGRTVKSESLVSLC